MKRIRRVLLITIILLTNSFYSLAQQSMIEDVSYPYLEKLVSLAKENYPKLKYYQGRTNAGKIQITQQKLSWLAPFTVSYIYQPGNTINLVNPTLFKGTQVGVNVNFGLLAQTAGNVKRAKEEYQSLIGEEQEAILLLENDVRTAYFAYVRNRKLLEVQTQNLLDVQSIEKEQKIRFERSEISLKEYNEALVTASTQLATKLQLEADVLSSKVTLETLVGKKLEDVK